MNLIYGLLMLLGDMPCRRTLHSKSPSIARPLEALMFRVPGALRAARRRCDASLGSRLDGHLRDSADIPTDFGMIW